MMSRYKYDERGSLMNLGEVQIMCRLGRALYRMDIAERIGSRGL
jgi:hypothetical protein